LLIISLHVIVSVLSVSLPSEFVPCQKANPDFKECLNKNILSAIQVLGKGVPSLKLKSIEPIFIEFANIGRGTGAVDVAQNYTNIEMHGLSKVEKIKVEKVDLDNLILEFEGYFPYLRWQAHYKASGKILLLPIYGDGESNITLINTASTHKLKGEFFTKKGNTYAKFTTYELRLNPESTQFRFDNLFNGNKLLGDNMNQVMNDNWEDLYKDVRSGYEDVIGAALQNYANKLFSRVPFDQIFL